MKKSIIVAIIIASIALGAALGAGGMYYAKVVAPEKKAKMIAQRQKEELNRMVRQGEVVEVSPQAITIKVNKGGGNIGETLTLKASEHTSIQLGMNFVNKPGEMTDLTKWFKPGDTINAMVKNDQAVALHRDIKPGDRKQNMASGSGETTTE